MRYIFSLLLFAAFPALAAGPYVVSDLLTVGVGACGVNLDAVPKVSIIVTAVNGGNICKYDLSSVAIAPGSHSITMTAIPTDPASLESSPSLPLSFTWPLPVPARPSGLRLVP